MAKGFKTGGRQKGSINKATADIKEAASQYSAAALNVLVEVANDVGAAPAARVAAANAILDRAHGKARQAVEIEGNEDRPLIQRIELVGVRPK